MASWLAAAEQVRRRRHFLAASFGLSDNAHALHKANEKSSFLAKRYQAEWEEACRREAVIKNR
jgi:hypothetical protein